MCNLHPCEFILYLIPFRSAKQKKLIYGTSLDYNGLNFKICHFKAYKCEKLKKKLRDHGKDLLDP